MRTSHYIAITSILLLAGCAAPQDTPSDEERAPAAAEMSDPSTEMIVGGYSEFAADDAGIQEIEALAIDALYKAHPTRMLATITKRESQVVAGLNYRFVIGMGGGEGNYKKMYVVVVYQSLDGELEVTDIAEISPLQ